MFGRNVLNLEPRKGFTMTDVFQDIITAVSGVFSSIFTGLGEIVDEAGNFLGSLS